MSKTKGNIIFTEDIYEVLNLCTTIELHGTFCSCKSTWTNFVAGKIWGFYFKSIFVLILNNLLYCFDYIAQLVTVCKCRSLFCQLTLESFDHLREIIYSNLSFFTLFSSNPPLAEYKKKMKRKGQVQTDQGVIRTKYEMHFLL